MGSRILPGDGPPFFVRGVEGSVPSLGLGCGGVEGVAGGTGVEGSEEEDMVHILSLDMVSGISASDQSRGGRAEGDDRANRSRERSLDSCMLYNRVME